MQEVRPPAQVEVRRASGSSWTHPGTIVGAAAIIVALDLWLVSLPDIDVSRISGWGLPPTLPVTWWVALALAVLPFVFSVLNRRVPTVVLGGHQLVVMVILFCTTAAVYEVPRYPWTYKHVGVVQHIIETGTLDRSIDIYNNWPGFFLVAGVLATVLHVDSLVLARWAEVAFSVLISLAMLYALRGVVRDRRVTWLALLLYTLANWVGTNYYSPQAAATVLQLVFLGLIIRLLPCRDVVGAPILRSLLGRRVPSRFVTPLPPSRLAEPGRLRVLGLVGATLVFAALVVTHQLTPVAVVGQVVALALVVRVRPLWIFAVWIVFEVVWVALAVPYLPSSVNLFEFDAIGNFQLPGAVLVPSLPGMAFVNDSRVLIVAVMAAATAAAFLFCVLRRSEALVVPTVLAAMPPTLLAVQSYGGEAMYRVYLYALPWASMIVAVAVVALWEARSRIGLGIAAGGFTVLLALAAPAMLGQEEMNHVDPADVAASRWFEDNTPAGSYALSPPGFGFPMYLTANYPEHRGNRPDSFNNLPGYVRGKMSTDQYLWLATEYFTKYGPHGYLVITPGSYSYGAMFGLSTTQELDALAAAIRSNHDYEVVDQAPGVLIAHYLPGS